MALIPRTIRAMMQGAMMARFNAEFNPLNKSGVVRGHKVQVGSIAFVQVRETPKSLVSIKGLPVLDLIAGTRGNLLLVVQNPNAVPYADEGDSLFMVVDPEAGGLVGVEPKPIKLAPALWALVAAHFCLRVWIKHVMLGAKYSRTGKRQHFKRIVAQLNHYDNLYKALIRLHYELS